MVASLSVRPSHTQWTLSRNDISPRYNPVSTRQSRIPSKRVGEMGFEDLPGMRTRKHNKRMWILKDERSSVNVVQGFGTGKRKGL